MPLAARVAANPAARQILARAVPEPGKKPPYRIENEFFTVEVEPGGTLSVLDRRSGTRYSGQNRFVDGGDRGDSITIRPHKKIRSTARV
jgi:hypothetical protein